MIIVSDTSTINYLILIEQIDRLSRLFDQIVIPEAVRDELSNVATPQLVQDWIFEPPNWLIISAVSQSGDAIVDQLDPGERAAILLAQQISADLVLLDDMKARRVAIEKGLTITGILGILDQAATMKLINLPDAVQNLRNTSFWVSDALLQKILDTHS